MVRVFAILGMLFSCLLVWIIFSADTGRGSIFFELVRVVPYGDKVGHFILFGILTLLVNVGSGFKRVLLFNCRPYLGALIIAVVVLLEECSQLYFPNRTFDFFSFIFVWLNSYLFSSSASPSLFSSTSFLSSSLLCFLFSYFLLRKVDQTVKGGKIHLFLLPFSLTLSSNFASFFLLLSHNEGRALDKFPRG